MRDTFNRPSIFRDDKTVEQISLGTLSALADIDYVKIINWATIAEKVDGSTYPINKATDCLTIGYNCYDTELEWISIHNPEKFPRRTYSKSIYDAKGIRVFTNIGFLNVFLSPNQEDTANYYWENRNDQTDYKFRNLTSKVGKSLEKIGFKYNPLPIPVVPV